MTGRIEPFLIVYGSGPRAEDVARDIIAEKCAARGLDAEVRPIDEIGQVTLVFYLALIIVLPSAPTRDEDVYKALQPFKHLIIDYRTRRPHGLKSFWEDSCKWFAVGVVQVCGLRAIMQHSHAKALLNSADICAKHYIDELDVDVFGVYDCTFPVLSDPCPGPDDNIYQKVIGKAWRAVHEWGVTDIKKVPRLRQCIDRCRDHYEDPHFSQLHRPIPKRLRNRLDIILDGPHDVVIGKSKTWQENGARVCRYVLEQLRKEVPELKPPGTRGVQEQLRELYQNLRIVEQARVSPGDPGLPD